MGFLLTTLGIGLVAVGIKKISSNIAEENRRRDTVCYFDGDISKEDFYMMVKCSRKGIRRIINLYAENTMVYGTVRSQSGISDWNFEIDFNDYGNLTGTYWLYTDHEDSNIPKTVADRIAQQIKAYSDYIDNAPADGSCGNDDWEAFDERQWSYCPYCGKKNYNENAKFCMYCGMSFRV